MATTSSMVVTNCPVDFSWPLKNLLFTGLPSWRKKLYQILIFFSFEFVSNVMKLCADVFMSVLVYRYKKIIVFFPQILVDIFVERQSTMVWVRWDAYKNPWSGVTRPFVPQTNCLRICRSGSVDGPCKRLQQASPYYWRKSFLTKGNILQYGLSACCSESCHRELGGGRDLHVWKLISSAIDV